MVNAFFCSGSWSLNTLEPNVIRITELQTEPGSLEIRVDGRIETAALPLLQKDIDEAAGRAKSRIMLNLQGVTGCDHLSIEFLCAIDLKAVVLINVPEFLRIQIDAGDEH